MNGLIYEWNKTNIYISFIDNWMIQWVSGQKKNHYVMNWLIKFCAFLQTPRSNGDKKVRRQTSVPHMTAQTIWIPDIVMISEKRKIFVNAGKYKKKIYYILDCDYLLFFFFLCSVVCVCPSPPIIVSRGQINN